METRKEARGNQVKEQHMSQKHLEKSKQIMGMESRNIQTSEGRRSEAKWITGQWVGGRSTQPSDEKDSYQLSSAGGASVKRDSHPKAGWWL